jgi:hypothetical protein
MESRAAELRGKLAALKEGLASCSDDLAELERRGISNDELQELKWKIILLTRQISDLEKITN